MTKMITEGNNKHNISGDPIRKVSLQFTRNDKHRNFNKGCEGGGDPYRHDENLTISQVIMFSSLTLH